jgi:hypothetical protein
MLAPPGGSPGAARAGALPPGPPPGAVPLTAAVPGVASPGAAGLSVASPDCAEAFFAGRAARCAGLRHAASLGQLRDVLEDAARGPARPGPLDLIGHSTRDHRLLRLGSTPVSMLDPGTAAFFAALAGTGVLARLRVTAVRLLGCETAVSDAGQRTVRMLSRALGLPVYGTLVPLLKSHWDAAGFSPAFSHVLTEASHLAPGPPGPYA